MSAKSLALVVTLVTGAIAVLFLIVSFFPARAASQQEQLELTARKTQTTEQADRAFESSVASLAHTIEALIQAGFKADKRENNGFRYCAFVHSQDRRIYLNLDNIKDNPTLAKQDRSWHTIAVHVRYRYGFEPKSYEMTPCLEHKSSEPFDPAHAILLDPGFDWTPEDWNERYNAIDKVALHSTHDAATVYFFDVSEEQAVYGKDNGNGVYGRILKFDGNKRVRELRRVLRNVFFDVPRGSGTVEQITPKPVFRRRRRKSISKSISPPNPDRSLIPDTTPPPPELDN